MKTTTSQYNNYRAWIREVANECLEKGINASVIFKNPGEIMLDEHLLHNNLTKRLIEFRYGKRSSKDLTTTEMNQIVKDIQDILIARTNGEINLPFNEKMPNM